MKFVRILAALALVPVTLVVLALTAVRDMAQGRPAR